MAQTGYTPISIYYSSTASNTPTAGNLVAGELAINTADGKLFYKDSAGVVQTLATKSATSGIFTSVTDSGLTSGRVTVAGTGGLLTDSAGLTWNGTVLNAGATGSSTIIANGNTAGNGGAALKVLGWASVAKNWEISAGFVGGFGLDFRPSTAAGGTTFTTSVLNIGENGSITSSSTIQSASTIGVGGTTPSSSGAGISFPATQSASSDANTLDDYEKGTWTPVVSTSIGSLTSYTSSGTYTKIGRQVFYTGNFTITSVGSAGGYATISSLPFTNSGSLFFGQARETASTGNQYQWQLNASVGTGYIWANSNGAIVWGNNYSYSFTAVCTV